MGHSDILEVIVYFKPSQYSYHIFRHLTGTCNCSELVIFLRFRWFGWIYVRYGGSDGCGESGKSGDLCEFAWYGSGESGGSDRPD